MDIEFVRLPLRIQKGLAIFLLITVLVLVYAPVKDYPFINYDDNLYVTEAPQVQQGLGWDSVVWSMTAMEAANWHPLTWLSHMLDLRRLRHQREFGDSPQILREFLGQSPDSPAFDLSR